MKRLFTWMSIAVVVYSSTPALAQDFRTASPSHDASAVHQRDRHERDARERREREERERAERERRERAERERASRSHRNVHEASGVHR
ncbi:hypothetical protein [Archangium violaceum]|uniref:ATP-dependent DNA helicase n=1 Tax=Archangium violaceum Cb vi76 TaxID=1406225 RepID=A0A084SVA3_9BACT|nr:hypothetical protein [Archangium violaceum]KFA92388.1 hypothetical protein Q664_15380 [Archangium violaceum Cb vi76]